MKRLVISIATALLGSVSLHALAQADAARAFPERPVRIVVPFGAAGGTTAVARVLAAKMAESFGQQVIGGRGAVGGVQRGVLDQARHALTDRGDLRDEFGAIDQQCGRRIGQ